MKAVDLFSGWGGFTEGAEQAGVDVVWAANHWPLAVEAHALNHPDVKHVCQDLRQANWMKLPSYDLLLASPACQGHSQASQPKRRIYHDELRATAWSVVDCADATSPQALIVENVVDFRRWRLYGVWRQALETLGYQLEELVLTASYFGVPQRRKRLFIVGTRNGRTVKAAMKACATAETPFGGCIDWRAGRWRPLGEASPGAQKRMRAGKRRHGPRFLTQHVTNHPGVPLDEPIRTITTKDQWGVVNGDTYRPLTLREYARAMAFPDSYGWPADANRTETIKGLGNAVPPPVGAKLIECVAGVM